MSVWARGYLPSNQRRDQILDCALAVFAHQGFHDTSIADICALARIGRGTLYEYFPDKRGVLAALIDRIVRRVLDAIQHWPSLALSPDAESAEETYVAFVEARCRQVMEAVFADADTASLILRMARGTGFVDEALARIEQEVVGVIAADVRAHSAWGVVQPVDPQLVAEFIVGGIEKLVLQALDAGRAIDVVRIARELAVLVSRGLLPRRPMFTATLRGSRRATIETAESHREATEQPRLSGSPRPGSKASMRSGARTSP